MTDRIMAFAVILKKNTREDDAACIKAAIEMIHGVLHVTSHVTDLCEVVAEQRIKTELRTKIFELLK